MVYFFIALLLTIASGIILHVTSNNMNLIGFILAILGGIAGGLSAGWVIGLRRDPP